MWLAKHELTLLLLRPPRLLLRPGHLRLLLSAFFPTSLLRSAAPRLLSSTSIAGACPNPPGAHFMVDYLVSSCGLSRDEAARVSRRFAHLKSQEKPDAVLQLLKREGLAIAQIRRVVLDYPSVLLANPSKTLAPKIRTLRGAGYSGSELAQLISSSPCVLVLRNVLPRIEFWRDLLGNNQNLLKATSRCGRILILGLNEKVMPKLSLLRSVGIPSDQVRAFFLRNPRVASVHIDRMKAIAEQVKSMGFTPGSRMFGYGFFCMINNSRSSLDAKFKLLTSFGWSQADLIQAFRIYPTVLCMSTSKIHAKMDFLLKEAECNPLYIARHPVLLGFSLERRLMPRLRVLQFLRREGLPVGTHALYTAMVISDEKFAAKYVVPNSDNFPEIFDIYHNVDANEISHR